MLGLLLAGALTADPPQASLITRFASPSVPPGGTAQIQLFLAEPHAFATGSVIVDFDSTVFGDVLAADVFSATGDQFGTANIKGSHVDVEFQSTIGEIGRLPNVPVVTIVVQVLAGAANLAVGTVSVTTGAKPWIDAGGNTYSMTVQPGSLSVGGNLSVEEVRHGGGMLPTGTLIGIAGTGFTPDTTVQIDGVSFALLQTVTSQEINLTPTAQADLTAKHVIVRNADGAQVDFVSALRGLGDRGFGNSSIIQPIFPQQTYSAANINSVPRQDANIAVENQNLDSVSVSFETYDTTFANAPTRFTTTLPSGSIYTTSLPGLVGIHPARSYVYSSAPIRMLQLSGAGSGLITPAPLPPVVHTNLVPTGNFVPLSSFLSWDWQIGSAAPVSRSLSVYLLDAPTDFAVSVTTDSGGNWLSVLPTGGTTCFSDYTGCPNSSVITVKVDPSSLDAGVYSGTITVNPTSPGATVVPATASVIFNVTAGPVISVPEQPIWFFADNPGSTAPSSLTVTSSADPVPISITTSTDSGANWLSVTPSQTVTPATLTVTANAALLGAQRDRGIITISGPGNSRTVVVNIQANFLPPPDLTASPSSLVFSAKVGSPPPPQQSISVTPYNVPPYFTSVSTVLGGIVFTSQPFQGIAYATSNWLTVAQLVRFPGLSVIVDPTGLAVGTYEGTITIWSAQVPVKLIVWDGPAPAITVTPSALLLSAPIGGSVTKTLRFASGDIPVPWTVVVATTDPYGWLSISNTSNATASSGSVTAATVDITASARVPAPGTYHGMVTINMLVGPVNLVTVPVTLTVTTAQGQAPQPGPPLATFLVNAASALASTIAPGEIITILGQNIGPPDPVGSATDPVGEAPTNLGGARVLFDGIAAPLLYASATQVNAIVPYEVATTVSTTVEVEYNGTRVPAGGFVVTVAAPAIFTVDSTGQGPAKARNADYSVNSAQNPAARGTVIHVYGTGEGVTSPLGVTGDPSSGKRPVLPVKVTIGGADAVLQDAVSLAGTMPWVLQVSALIPQGILPGDSVPIVLTIGSAHSQDGVTIAVK